MQRHAEVTNTTPESDTAHRLVFAPSVCVERRRPPVQARSTPSTADRLRRVLAHHRTRTSLAQKFHAPSVCVVDADVLRCKLAAHLRPPTADRLRRVLVHHRTRTSLAQKFIFATSFHPSKTSTRASSNSHKSRPKVSCSLCLRRRRRRPPVQARSTPSTADRLRRVLVHHRTRTSLAQKFIFATSFHPSINPSVFGLRHAEPSLIGDGHR